MASSSPGPFPGSDSSGSRAASVSDAAAEPISAATESNTAAAESISANAERVGQGGTATLPQTETAEIRAVRRRGFAVGFATGLYGLSFGALATAAGLDLWQAVVLSAVMFTGGSQFAFVGVISGGGSALGAVLTAVLLGIRNTLYGLSLSRVLPRRGWRRLLQAHLTIDESAATAASGTTVAAQRAGFFSAGVWVFVFWNIFSVLGALAGQLMSDPTVWGLDAAAAAAFLALLWPRLRSGEAVAVAVAAAALALLTTPVLPAGVPVIAAVLVAVLAGLRGADGEAAAGPTENEVAR